MSERTIKLTQPVEKTIEAVLAEFLEEQRKRLKSSTMRKYEDIIDLFQSCLNNYAYQSLDKQESALFDRLYNAVGDERREFYQVFGPEKIPGNVSEFLNYFIIRKVMCGKELKQTAGTVIKKLGKWLQEKEYVRSESAIEVVDCGATAAKELPATEKLARMLADYADCTAVDCDEVIEDHFTIEAVEPGKLRLSAFSGNDEITVPVSQNISNACHVGWSISGAVGKTGKDWCILEVWNVYP
jgi:CO dehydrogenase/acetyl-CoA synthase delta subunit